MLVKLAAGRTYLGDGLCFPDIAQDRSISPGDELRGEIEGLGTIANRVVRAG